MGLKDSKSDTYHGDGSTASAAVLDGGRMDGSTTTIGVACADSGGSLVLILGDSQGKDQQSFMESLPADIVQDILSRVPAESVLGCKLVCKKWVKLIRGNHFASMHLRRLLNHLHDGDEDNLAAKVEPGLFFAGRTDDPDVYRTLLFHGGQLIDRINNDEKYIYNQNLKRIYHPRMHHKPLHIHLVGSCNGLVCAFQHHHLVIDPIYICNPLTREYVYLPQLVVNEEDLVDPEFFRIEGGVVSMVNQTACGFGYVSSTNEYKVVRIHYVDYEEGIVEVYTLGSGFGWRAIGEIPYRLDMSWDGKGICVKDAIYWTTYNKVVKFDLAKEEFRLLPAPPCMQNLQNEDKCGLVALGRQLCYYMDKLRIEIWSLMESNDSKETWRMECDFDYEPVVGSRESHFLPILLAKNGQIIFLYDESVLYCYDKTTTVLKMISNEASADYLECVEAVAHVNTLVSLEAMGENSKRYTVHPCGVGTPWDHVIDELDRVALGEVDRVALSEEIDTTRFRFRRA
ncbi:F-box protein At3g07870-like [Papaver somniferum]|uniref:F-box protein At3g07870-like n=1 Tax=Papaver somniferum TaxID=3469 RepID=UPI000E6FE8FF|nr:F-box protein At3g07870-like [Papaver somniferum]XP_026431212.1 F-box protein At3g07870-like [Papaver somniferum]